MQFSQRSVLPRVQFLQKVQSVPGVLQGRGDLGHQHRRELLVYQAHPEIQSRASQVWSLTQNHIIIYSVCNNYLLF